MFTTIRPASEERALTRRRPTAEQAEEKRLRRLADEEERKITVAKKERHTNWLGTGLEEHEQDRAVFFWLFLREVTREDGNGTCSANEIRDSFMAYVKAKRDRERAEALEAGLEFNEKDGKEQSYSAMFTSLFNMGVTDVVADPETGEPLKVPSTDIGQGHKRLGVYALAGTFEQWRPEHVEDLLPEWFTV